METEDVVDVAFTVNGEPVQLQVPVRATLVDVLRSRLGLTGTHVGCEEGVCGSCTVLLDGLSVLGCLVLAVQADQAEVTTLEGLGGAARTSGPAAALTASLSAEHGIQCGFCTPGIVVRGTELLAEDPAPAVGDVVRGLCGNLCRCTGYAGIVRAVVNASAGPDADGATARVEDDRLVRGEGEFVADVLPPGALHCAFVRSTVAAGSLDQVDVAAARALPGVVAVYTASDLNPLAGPVRPTPMLDADDAAAVPPLADGRVHFVGEPVALVVAQDRYVAEDAVDLVQVEVTPAEPVLDLEAALEDGSPLAVPAAGSNLAQDSALPMRPRLRTAFDEAPHVVRVRRRQQRQANAPLEPRGVVVGYDPESGQLTAAISTQNPHEAKRAMARATRLAREAVHVTARDVGGSFGLKFWTGREELVVAVAARDLGRTLAWIEDRRENLTASPHARSDLGVATFALDDDGRILGTHLEHLEDTGAHPTGVIARAGPFVGMLFTGPYRVPLHSFSFRSVRTNTAPRGAYRGPWAFATVAREEMLDEVARAVGLDPLELRRRNVVSAGDLPYSMPTRLVLDHVTPAATLEDVARRLDYAAARDRQRDALAEGRLVGIGLALGLEPSSIGSMEPIASDTARLQLEADGTVTAFLATGAGGQGVETTMAQVIAEVIGRTPGDVRVVQGDTDRTPFGRGTGASGTAVITGSACRAAAADLLGSAVGLAGELLGVSGERVIPSSGSLADREDHARAVSWADLAAATAERGAGPLEGTGSFTAPPQTWSNACHGCVVEIDQQTGQVVIQQYVVAEDCGTIIDESVVRGQVEGGVLQGIGGALSEEVRYDALGRPLVRGLGDYKIPTAGDAVVVDWSHVGTLSPIPGGHKGMAQGGASTALACVFNAVADALAQVGARVEATPLGPEQVLRALREAAPPPQSPAAPPGRAE